ncbi:MAG TPA: hypothetical protein VK507_14850, partial [Iamia sp.]|nr:hypothetical protein [Iamia sp.]
MATMWRKAMLYLGLGPDEEYDDYDPGYDEPAPAPGTHRQAQSPPLLHDPEPHQQQSAVGAVRPMTPVRPDSGPTDFASQVGAGMGSGMGGGGIGAVTPSGVGGVGA